jgi:hypothetical protein
MIYQRLPLQDPPECTQILIFGLKIYHLATLLHTRPSKGAQRRFACRRFAVELIPAGLGIIGVGQNWACRGHMVLVPVTCRSCQQAKKYFELEKKKIWICQFYCPMPFIFLSGISTRKKLQVVDSTSIYHL